MTSTVSSASSFVLRLHVEGPMGVGKTTLIDVIKPYHFKPTNTICSTYPNVLKIPEPMKCWRNTFVDLINASAEMPQAVEEIRKDLECEDLRNDRRNQLESLYRFLRQGVLSLQMQFSDPYLLLDHKLKHKYGSIAGPASLFPPSTTLVFDRHSLSSTACFPAARVINGDCDVSCFLSAMIKTPEEKPGCNIWVLELLDGVSHANRIIQRNREGESAAADMLTALQIAYRMLIATVRYAAVKFSKTLSGKSGYIDADEWSAVPWFTEERRNCLLRGFGIPAPTSFADMKCPVTPKNNTPPLLSNTLLSLLKTTELCDSNTGMLKTPYDWAAIGFLQKLVGINIFSLNVDNLTPENCADSISQAMPYMTTTVCSEESLEYITTDIRDFLKTAV